MGLVGLALIGLFGYMILKRAKPITEVMYCRDRDRRGQKLVVTEETAHSLRVERKGLLTFRSRHTPLRFIKLAGAYVFTEGGKMVTRFFGKEGTAYTWRLEGNEEIKVGPLPELLKGIWGDKFYLEIPRGQRDAVEDENVYVTVKIGEGLTPEGFSAIKEEDITHEEETRAARTLGTGIQEKTAGKTLYEGLLWAAVGFAVCFALYNFGVFT